MAGACREDRIRAGRNERRAELGSPQRPRYPILGRILAIIDDVP